jgi:hypothetical protein
VTQRLGRIGGALGIGITWAAVWGGGIGSVVMLGFLLSTGSRPDPPFPLMLGAAGFITGVMFSGILRLGEGRRRFDQMSLPRFAAWGAVAGVLLSAAFVLTVALGDRAFLWYLIPLGPSFAIAAAASAAGSLAVARKARRWRHLLVPLGSDI